MFRHEAAVIPARKILAIVALMTTILGTSSTPAFAASGVPLTTIQHLVVIFQENVSFDHYFGTYPKALNSVASRASRHATTLREIMACLLVCFFTTPTPTIL